MILLLDTHLLLWAAGDPGRLSTEARTLLSDPANELTFSAASIWEVAIKLGLGRDDFQVDPRLLRRGLLANGYREVPVTGEHAIELDHLATHYRDPFDRILICQARVEGSTLLTTDGAVAKYGAPVRRV
ncbi:MAG: type II toxin-antitoxin system VapC family toxin [Deltaproteobacteria bacterium]|nr:type II toxin-antitoxin system VapC family toxin [Deltaproteobacteria bacterium]